MTTTYSVNWRVGDDKAVPGLLEITPDAVHFTPAAGGPVAEVPFAEVPAVHRLSSTVELERRSGDRVRIASAAAGILGAELEALMDLAEKLRSLRAEHDHIDEELDALRTVVDALAGLTEAREQEVRLLIADLMRRVVHHARIEERELYPTVRRRLGCSPLVEAMLFDHRAIQGHACELVRVEPGDCTRLTCAFHRLDALLTAHIAKEEAIVFPLLESR
jgi:hemerythrin superfamily protein